MYEVNQNNGETQCWIGLNKMMENPSGNRCPHCFDKCFAKEISITPVQIREEKFISSNDVVSTIITTDRYLLLVLTYALSTYLHRGVVPGGAKILAYQLTLSQPGGAHYPHPVLQAPPDFQTLRRP